VYVNRRGAALLGRDPASLVGRDYHAEFPEARGQPFFAVYERAMTTGEPAVFEAHYAPWDRWFENRVYPGPHGLTILFTDVTERRRAALALHDSEIQIEAICAAIPVLIWTWDLATNEIWRGGRLLQQLGYALDTIPTNGLEHADWWNDHVHPDDHAAYTVRAQQMRTTGDVPGHATEYRFRRADGSYATLSPEMRVLRDEAGHPVRAVGIVVDVSARVEAARALRDNEERYALAARATNVAIWEWAIADGGLTWSPGVHAIFGHAPEKVSPTVGWWYDRVHPDDRERVRASLQLLLEGAAGDWRDTYRFRRGDGSWADVVDRGTVMRDASGRAVRMIGAMEDVTAQRQLEDRLRQAQKMEAVGQLAGGIAHDFNNLLTVISGNLEFVRGAVGDAHPARADVDEIGYAAGRARALVRQLLAFSRKQPVQPRLVRVPELVRDTERMLRRVLGEEIAFAVRADDTTPAVHADPGQLQQVLVNLAVNARDAMLTPRHGHPGTGGVLGVDVDETDLAAGGSDAWAGLPPGRYVRLRVRDTGHGMDDATRARVFEPFFTTKAVGAGTGLGLATVFGIVHQAGGAIAVESVPGAGTTFTVLLPAAPLADDDAAPAPAAATVPAPGRGATVLLAEDEAPVRGTARRMLEQQGYRVLEANDGASALAVWRAHRDAIDALVADLRMPALDGVALAAALRTERPELPVVLVSGYPAGTGVDDQPPAALDAAEVVDKPFTAAVLLAALARALPPARVSRGRRRAGGR
jgi:PAS domain S-box-containing protein